MCRVGETCDNPRGLMTIFKNPKPKTKSNNCCNIVKNPFNELYERNFDIEEGRCFFLSRHGESDYNIEERIGGDSGLTSRGKKYAEALGNYMKSSGLQDLEVWTSSLVRTKQTAAFIPVHAKIYPEIDEINAGVFDSLTYEEIEEKFQDEHEKRQKDKLTYKYPRGESYIDCCRRILPILEKIELNKKNLLIIAHQAVLRCIVTYFLKEDLAKLPYVKIPQHCLIRITRINGQNVLDYIRIPIDHSEQGITKSALDQ